LVNTYDIKAKDFVEHLSTHYDLSVLVSMDRFFYVVKTEKEVLALRTHHFPAHNYLQLQVAFEHICQSDRLLRLPYRRIHVALLSPTTTLIPVDLYDAARTRFYLEHNAVLTDNDVVLEDKLFDIGTHQVYAFNQTIFETLQTQLPEAEFSHALSNLIVAYGRFNKGKTVYANLIGTYIQIVVFDGQKLLFANTFTQHSDKDVMYFIGLIYNQLELDWKKNRLVLSGEITPESLSYFTLQKYIKHLEFLDNPTYVFKHHQAPANWRFVELTS